MSLGEMRKTTDKKGTPCKVFDVIWNPESIKKAKTDMLMRQGVIELAFHQIKEKYGRTLNMKYSLPKMDYKGETVAFQRVRAKTPKIKTLQAQQLSKEE